MNQTLEAPVLSAADRCDRCGAQAFVKYVLRAGGELTFCAHHSRANAEALTPISSQVIDETERLDPAPPSIED